MSTDLQARLRAALALLGRGELDAAAAELRALDPLLEHAVSLPPDLGTWDAVRRHLVHEALRACGGRKDLAARRLGVARRTFAEWLKMWPPDEEPRR